MKFTIALLAGISNALLTRNQTTKFGKTETQLVNEIKSRLVGAEENPQEMWFNATIDHFDNHGAGSATYPMRYLYDTTYFDREKGPIIFYAGNEGDVWTFWDASGFMHTTLAQQFGALVVFGEHRYYGESMPFGD